MTELTAREKITKYCKIEKQPGRGGDLLIYGHHKYRMNRKLDKLTDAECDKVLKLMELDDYIAKRKIAPVSKKGVINTAPKACECGCGQVTGRGSKFRPGHDMRLKCRLRKLAAGNDAKAKEALKARGWA